MATEQDLDQIFSTVLTYIRGNKSSISTSVEIEDCVDLFCNSPLFSCKKISQNEREQIVIKVKRSEGVTMKIGSIISDESSEFKEWLPLIKDTTPKQYWSSYRRILASQPGFTTNVLFSFDEVTDRIMEKCSDPNSVKACSRKGMVVGSVQSGKTANYIGLITKAADYGYKVIIVIAGIHENLRSQTQKRINYGFIGQDTSALTSKGLLLVGVGQDRDQNVPVPFPFTHEKFDFDSNKANGCPYVLDANLDRPVVFVIKKNPNILNNLNSWLRSSSSIGPSGKIELPLLLIDDEADNASINIAYDKDQVSKINKQIRLVLDCFSTSTYIGYTATPFANIFIDPDSQDEMNRQDLFPRDFIVGLEPPSSYIGAADIFLEPRPSLNSHLIELDDYMDCIPLKHKKSLEPLLPSSLVDAIYCYILSDAIKLLRGIYVGRSTSMLINVTYFTDVHLRLKILISNLLDEIKQSIRSTCGLSQEFDARHVIELKRCYTTYYKEANSAWLDIRKNLQSICSRFKVVTVNSNKTTVDGLNYDEEEGSSLIAIGGFSLSRGLTLEGLTISYFLRGTVMYDTLLQMGRWFGYRSDYEDLCRLWITKEAIEWYSHIALADEDLRTELATLERSRLTPLDFGLKVLSHPGALLVTARNKMGASQEICHSICLSDRLIETIDIELKPAVISSNYHFSNLLISQSIKSADVLGTLSHKKHSGMYGYLIPDVPVDLISSYLRSFASVTPLTRDPRPILEYINKRREGEMSLWDLFIPSPHGSSSVALDCGIEVNLQKRTCTFHPKDSPKDGKLNISLSSRGKVAGRGLEKVGLSDKKIEELEKQWISQQPDKKSIADRAYRYVGRKPLIAIHFINISESPDVEKYSPPLEFPVTAWSISFQPTNSRDTRDNTVEYRVNRSWLRMLDFTVEPEEIEGAGDDI